MFSEVRYHVDMVREEMRGGRKEKKVIVQMLEEHKHFRDIFNSAYQYICGLNAIVGFKVNRILERDGSLSSCLVKIEGAKELDTSKKWLATYKFDERMV